MITLHSIWCGVLDDRSVAAHDIIPEAMRRVTKECARLMVEAHTTPLQTGEALDIALAALRTLEKSSY